MFFTFLDPPTSLMIYSTVNHEKLPYSDPNHPPLWWCNTWMVPNLVLEKICITKRQQIKKNTYEVTGNCTQLKNSILVIFYARPCYIFVGMIIFIYVSSQKCEWRKFVDSIENCAFSFTVDHQVVQRMIMQRYLEKWTQHSIQLNKY